MTTLLVAYDIAQARRLQRVAKLMERYGVRVQKSVFECRLTEARRKEMTERLVGVLEPGEDQVRIYSVPPEVLAGQRQLGRRGPDLPALTVVG
jgi:CRISPR-associated protein Cas2